MFKFLKKIIIQVAVIFSGLIIAIIVLLVVLGWMFKNTHVEFDANKPLYAFMDIWSEYQTHWGMIPEDDWQKNPLILQRKIVFTTNINPRSSKKLIEQLLYLDQEQKNMPIDLYIRTTGGWWTDAFAVHDAMRSLHSQVNVYAIGQCDSAGAVILAGATGHRYSFPNASIMVHANLSDSEEKFNWRGNERRRVESFWKTYAKLPGEWFPMTKDKEYYLTPEEALKYGIIDEIISKQTSEPVAAANAAQGAP